MEYELKTPISVYNRETGREEPHNMLIVKFIGKPGLLAIKRLQDTLMKMFKDSAAGGKEGGGEDKQKDAGDLKVDDLVNALDLSGNAALFYESILKEMAQFCTVQGIGTRLKTELQEDMDIDDLEGLCKEVAKHFLVERFIQNLEILSS